MQFRKPCSFVSTGFRCSQVQRFWVKSERQKSNGKWQKLKDIGKKPFRVKGFSG
jgi:hypothetical protein